MTTARSLFLVGPALLGLAACTQPDSSEPPLAGAADQALLGAGAACSSDCACGRGLRCTGGVCASYVEFGPIPAPPFSPPCVCDAQCPSDRFCTNNQASPTSYGYCVAASCSAGFSPTFVPAGSSTLFTLASHADFDSPLPAGSFSRMYGTRNGVQDAFGEAYPFTAAVFSIANTPGLAGSYTRYVGVHRPDGGLLCTTGVATSVFAP